MRSRSSAQDRSAQGPPTPSDGDLRTAIATVLRPQRLGLTGELWIRWQGMSRPMVLTVRRKQVLDVRGPAMFSPFKVGDVVLTGCLSTDMAALVGSGTHYEVAAAKAVRQLERWLAKAMVRKIAVEWAPLDPVQVGGFPLPTTLLEVCAGALRRAHRPDEIAARFRPYGHHRVEACEDPWTPPVGPVAHRTLELVAPGPTLDDLILHSGRGRFERTEAAWWAFDQLFHLDLVHLCGDWMVASVPPAPGASTPIVPPARASTLEDPDDEVSVEIWDAPEEPDEGPATERLGAGDLGHAHIFALPDDPDDPDEDEHEHEEDQPDPYPVEDWSETETTAKQREDPDPFGLHKDQPPPRAKLSAAPFEDESMWVEAVESSGAWNRGRVEGAQLGYSALERLRLLSERLDGANPMAVLALPWAQLPDQEAIGDAYDHRVLEFHEARWVDAGEEAIRLAARCRRLLRRAMRALTTPDQIEAELALWMKEGRPADPYDLG